MGLRDFKKSSFLGSGFHKKVKCGSVRVSIFENEKGSALILRFRSLC